MEQSWKQAKAAFGFVLAPPTLWLLLFFLAPMAVIWAYSFGENVGLTEIDISGTFKNYIRAFDPLYLGIFWKSAVTAGITTFLCLVIGFPVAMGIAFASPKTKAWLLLLIMLPFWTNLLIRTFALGAAVPSASELNAANVFPLAPCVLPCSSPRAPMRQPSPNTTWATSRVPSPMNAPAPTWHWGPMRTPGPITAPAPTKLSGPTLAVASICAPASITAEGCTPVAAAGRVRAAHHCVKRA